MANSCALCGSTNRKITNEHVFGAWIGTRIFTASPHWSIVRTLDPATLEHQTTSDIDIPRPLHDVKVRVLCESCNTEWGSAVEAGVQPFFGALIRRVPGVLDVVGATALATWAMKVTIMRQFANPKGAQNLVPAIMGRELRFTGQPPSQGVSIWLATSDTHIDDPWWCRSRLGSLARRPSDPLASVEDLALGFLHGMTFNHLAMFVVGAPKGERPREIATEFPQSFARLWPRPQRVEWPLPVSLTNDELEVFFEAGGGFMAH